MTATAPAASRSNSGRSYLTIEPSSITKFHSHSWVVLEYAFGIEVLDVMMRCSSILASIRDDSRGYFQARIYWLRLSMHYEVAQSKTA